jgi:hypothetical protein
MYKTKKMTKKLFDVKPRTTVEVQLKFGSRTCRWSWTSLRIRCTGGRPGILATVNVQTHIRAGSICSCD